MATTTEQKFADIALFGSPGSGVFKVAQERMGWACVDKDLPQKIVGFSKDDLEKAEFQRCCGRSHFLLQLQCKGEISCFSGFKLEDMTHLKNYIETHYGVDTVVKSESEIAVSGASWFDWHKESEDALKFQLQVDGKTGIEIPFAELSNATAVKSDLCLEMKSTDLLYGDNEVLHEIRLFVPGQLPGAVTAPLLSNEIMSQRTGGGIKSKPIACAPGIPLAAPRGKHDFEFFEKVVRVRGASHSYNLEVQQIQRLFLLTAPSPDTTNPDYSLVISLSPPFKQANKSHPFLVLSLSGKKMAQFTDFQNPRWKDLNLTGEFEQRETTLVPRLFKEISQKIVVAESSDFRGEVEKIVAAKKRLDTGTAPCLKCMYKTTSGLLYPLKKSMIFVKAPVVWLRYEDVECVDFQLGFMKRNAFDLWVRDVNGTTHEFKQITKDLFEALLDFWTKIGVKCNAPDASAVTGPATQATRRSKANALVATAPSSKRAKTAEPDAEDDPEEADDDFEGGGSSDEEDQDGSDDDDEEEEEPQSKRRSTRKR